VRSSRRPSSMIRTPPFFPGIRQSDRKLHVGGVPGLAAQGATLLVVHRAPGGRQHVPPSASVDLHRGEETSPGLAAAPGAASEIFHGPSADDLLAHVVRERCLPRIASPESDADCQGPSRPRPPRRFQRVTPPKQNPPPFVPVRQARAPAPRAWGTAR